MYLFFISRLSIRNWLADSVQIKVKSLMQVSAEIASTLSTLNIY